MHPTPVQAELVEAANPIALSLSKGQAGLSEAFNPMPAP